MSEFVYFIMKVGILGSLFMYLIFAFVITKQVNKMTETLKLGFELPIKIFALLHLIFSLGILLLGFVIL